ncbi:CFEM domain-containing protein [Candidatus Bathyarchaeota archaeon]|nr:CFEM domain-containing protein [Candidatus Bathyarchaeota archaeon]
MATGDKAIWEQKEAVPEQTPAPALALPREEMGPSTTCEVVASPAGDCALHRPTFAPCGRDCLSPGIAEVGCGVDDFACQCAPDAQAALSSLVRPCVEESCGDPSAVAIQWDASASEFFPLPFLVLDGC